MEDEGEIVRKGTFGHVIQTHTHHLPSFEMKQ